MDLEATWNVQRWRHNDKTRVALELSWGSRTRSSFKRNHDQHKYVWWFQNVLILLNDWVVGGNHFPAQSIGNCAAAVVELRPKGRSTRLGCRLILPSFCWPRESRRDSRRDSRVDFYGRRNSEMTEKCNFRPSIRQLQSTKSSRRRR